MCTTVCPSQVARIVLVEPSEASEGANPSLNGILKAVLAADFLTTLACKPHQTPQVTCRIFGQNSKCDIKCLSLSTDNNRTCISASTDFSKK